MSVTTTKCRVLNVLKGYLGKTMANAKALSDEYESCEQCGEYVHRTTGMDKRVEINVSDTDHFRNWLFCSMDCLREWATENE